MDSGARAALNRYTETVNDREFRKHLTEKRLEAIRAEVRAEKKPPA